MDIYAPDEIPIGGIVEYNGLLTDIDFNYQLCDGTRGTPDLHDLFLRGAASGHEAGGTGGEQNHTLTTAEIPAHNHGVTDPGHNHSGLAPSGTFVGQGTFDIPRVGTGSNLNSSATGITINNAGSGNSHENRPAFFELAFIMRMQ